MKFSLKRVLSFALVMLMVISLLPTTTSFDANAAGTLSTITGLTATWTDASNSMGSASWSASGTSITGTTTGYKGMILSHTVNSTLTLTNNSGGEATLSFNYTLTNGGSVSGAISGTSGGYSSTLADGASISIKLTSPKGASTNTLSITGLSLISTSAGNVTTTFKPATVGGSYTVAVGTATAESVSAALEKTNAAGTEYTVVATAASGYQFFGWYDETNGVYLDYNATYAFKPAANMTVVPKFVSTTTALFGVGAARFDNLTEAGAFAAAGSNKTIILLNNGTVAGTHTIPAGTTLLVPFDSANTLYTTEPAHTNNYAFNTASWVQPTAYRTLTLAADANITVNGSISVSGKHFAGGGNPTAGGCGVPTEKVGFVQMVAGSQITLNSGANLYAWGYVTGGGTITAKSGAKVYENFMIRDFRGGGATTTVANDGIVFPLSQYYVQNIEVSTDYEYGAEEHVYTSLYISGMSYSAGVKFIGDGAMFQTQEGAVLTKDYIENKDRLELTVNGNAALANMSLSLASTDIDSSTFILPINSNITININSGTTTLKQDLALLPGVEMNIAQGAVLDLASGTGSGTIESGTGYNLFVYDLDEWNYGYSVDTFDPDDVAGSEKTTGVKYVHQSYQWIALKYAPGRTYTRTASDLKDAVINVNGTIITDGFLYTTEGGASIISSEKTGVIAMNSGAGVEMFTYQAGQNDTTPVYYVIPITSAQLQNGDGTYVSTADATAGTSYNYCATHDHWVKQVTVTFNANGGTGTMANQTLELPCCEKLNTNEFTNDGYTFGAWNTVAGGSGTAYSDGGVTNATENITLYAQWNEVVTAVEIQWDIDGTKYGPQEVTIGETPVYNGTPTKAANGCTTYTFAGWSTEANGGGTKYPVGTNLPAANADATYYAYFTESTSHVGDTDNDHKCNGCSTPLTDCADTNNDHICDYAGCKATLSTCVDDDRDHYCDYSGCKAELSTCVDGDDENHNCDYVGCGKENVDDGCHGGKATCMAAAVCDECGQPYGSKDATNHTKQNTTVKDAVTETCGKEGYTGDTYCECGEKIATGTSIPATGKHYDNPTDGNHSCDVCNAANVTKCSGGTAYCNALAVCSDCGESYGEFDKDNHASSNFTFVDNKNGTHTKKHACCSAEVVTEGHSYDPATHECECGALETFTVTWLFNGGVMDEQWKQQLISEGFTVTDTSVSGTFPYDDFAPHAPGVTKDGYILIGYTDQYGKFNAGQESFTLTEDMTYTMVWECAHSDKTYTDLGNGFHKVTCDNCSETLVESEGHDYTYDKRYHKCQCGAVEEFKLTVVYGINGEYSFEIMVPYWTRMDSLDEINNIPWDIYANDATHFGRFFVDDYFWDMDGDGDLDRDRYFTEGYMTDEDMYVEVRYDFNGFVHDGNGWKYRKYGSFYKDEMITLTEYDVYENGSDEVIEGFYMVGADGYRIENGLGRWYYLGPWNGVTYEPNAEDIAYCESKGQTFIDKEMTWYYFGADGKLAFDYTGLVGDSYVINGQAAWHVGLVEIDGEYYYFKGDEVNGGNKMVTGCDYYVSRNKSDFNMVVGGIYTFDNDGKMQWKFHGIVESELFEGKRHYIGGRLTPGLGLMDLITVATGEVRYFYVDAYGQLILDAEYYIGANSLGIPKGVYYFDAEGFLVMPEADPLKNGFYFENGNWFYYVDGVKGYCAGLISTSGILWFETADAQGVENEGWVYVKSNGALATGEYYVTNVQENCVSGVKSGDLCKFGSNGLMQTAKSGIVDGYYYENNAIAYGAGLIEIDGSYYYVRSNGQVVMGRSYWITKTNGLKDAGCYEFDADGKMIVSDKNGVVAEDGALYYYVDGIKQIGNGLVKLEDGSYIYVRSNGQLATGLYWTTNHNGVLTEGVYDFGENGILVIE